MLTPPDINSAYSQFFIEWASENLTRSKTALFVTTTFDHESSMRRRRETAGLTQGSYEKLAFHHLYNAAAKMLVGSNYNRPSKRDRLPRVAGFLDSEGTRFWRRAGELRNIHLHAIWIIERCEVARLNDALDLAGSNGDYFRALGFDAVDVEPIGASNDDLARVISYSSKLLGFNNRDLELGMDFEVYPLAVRGKSVHGTHHSSKEVDAL